MADKISEKENELLRCPAVDESSVDLLRRQRIESQKKVRRIKKKLREKGDIALKIKVIIEEKISQKTAIK